MNPIYAKILQVMGDTAFLTWCGLRLWFHIASGNAGWSALFGGALLLSAASLAAELL